MTALGILSLCKLAHTIQCEYVLCENGSFLQLLFLVLLLNGEGLCECYNELSCSGAVIQAADQKDCCILKSGLSFSNIGTCRQ